MEMVVVSVAFLPSIKCDTNHTMTTEDTWHLLLQRWSTSKKGKGTQLVPWIENLQSADHQTTESVTEFLQPKNDVKEERNLFNLPGT